MVAMALIPRIRCTVHGHRQPVRFQPGQSPQRLRDQKGEQKGQQPVKAAARRGGDRQEHHQQQHAAEQRHELGFQLHKLPMEAAFEFALLAQRMEPAIALVAYRGHCGPQ
jgi:hypothetical protein